MRFFTAELYERCRSSDEAVLDAACVEWERANERYEQHLHAIEPELPAHIREFAGLLLHDARVQSIARHGNQLILVLHKDIPPRDLVILRYELAGEPIVQPFTTVPDDWSQLTDFQFDEFDVERDGEQVLYRQSIVLGNGWAIHLCFRDVQTMLARPVYPVLSGGTTPEFTLSYST